MQISCGASAVLFYLKFFIAIIFLKVKHKGKPAQRNVPSLPLTGRVNPQTLFLTG